MKTVTEVSKLTGISVRTLHYYDEIGLLRPTCMSESGYRLYDGHALEMLQQILFFREFDMPLKEIKMILDNPAYDREQVLTEQRKLLVLKKERLERLIFSIDGILKGEKQMDFAVFSRDEIETVYRNVFEGMAEEQKRSAIQQYGSLEQYREHIVQEAMSENAQKNFAKAVEWYGDKESALAAATDSQNPKEFPEYQKQLEDVMRRIADKCGTDVKSPEIRALVQEYDAVSQKLWRMRDVTAMTLELAKMYQENEPVQEAQDAVYGAGTTRYIGQVLEQFYTKS